MELYPDAFYHKQPEVMTWPWYEVLDIPMPIRKDIIDVYTSDVERNRIWIDRPRTTIAQAVDHLPNLVELTAWWLSYMSLNEGQHGMRSFISPSSTPWQDRVLCLYFMVNDALGVRPSPSRSDSYTVVKPDGTIVTHP
jgi:hypothetical protein